MASYQSLEKVLAKLFNPGDPLIGDGADFDSLVSSQFRRKSVILGIRDYLRNSGSSPRVAALIAYSEEGAELMRSWVEDKGMPVPMLYSALLLDGGAWAKVEGRPAISNMIERGGDEWNFDPKTIFSMYTSIQSMPGIMESLIQKMRARGEIDRVFYYMPVRSIADLLNANREAFIEEEAEIPIKYSRLIDKTNEIHDLAVSLCRTYLSEDVALAKLLGSELG